MTSVGSESIEPSMDPETIDGSEIEGSNMSKALKHISNNKNNFFLIAGKDHLKHPETQKCMIYYIKVRRRVNPTPATDHLLFIGSNAPASLFTPATNQNFDARV